MAQFKLQTVLLLFLLSSITYNAHADFISLIKADECETIIEIFIEENQVRVTFEIGLNDLEHFKELIPDEYLSAEIRKLLENQDENHFYTDVFILEAAGKKLKGSLSKREFMPRKYRASLYTGVVDTNINVSKMVLFAEIVYPIKNKPGRVSIIPPIEEGFRSTLANIGFITYHKKIPVNDLRYLGQEAILNLNWDDPWYSKFDNRNLRRHHQSSLMSFLYVDPYEVRHEVLVRLKDLENWLNLGYKLDDYIEVEELDTLKSKIANFLVDRNIVTIDGNVHQPIIDKIHFVKWSLAGIQIQEIKERMDYSSAVIGVIFAYPHDSIAQKITIDWDMFSDKISEVPNVATDPAGPMPYTLKTDDNVITWINYLKKYKLPTISDVRVSKLTLNIILYSGIFLAVLGLLLLFFKGLIKRKFNYSAAILLLLGCIIALGGMFYEYRLTVPFVNKTTFTKPEASELVTQLLKNTYRAFDFREESDIYDKLAISYSGDLLSEVYLQTRQSMVLENQGGIQVKVKQVDVTGIEEVPAKDHGLAFRCSWLVKGDVGHWGHIHQRTNQYDAILYLRLVNGVWKLFDIEIIEEVRL